MLGQGSHPAGPCARWGLFVSDELGSAKVDVDGLAELDYAAIARAVLGLLLPDYTADEIAACVNEAYTGTFASPEVTPVVPAHKGTGRCCRPARARARALPRPHERVQGRRPADAAALDGARPGICRRGREDHDRDRHLGRHGQGGARRLCRRPGVRHHRLLPRRQGQPRAGAADDHAGGGKTWPSPPCAATSTTRRAP